MNALSVGSHPNLVGLRNAALQSEGYIVTSAFSLREAVSLFHDGDFDLILLCHSVPEIDRNRLACLIRASGSRIPLFTVAGQFTHHDAFADATLEDRPDKLLTRIQDVMRSQTPHS